MLELNDPARGQAIAALRAARLMTQAALADAARLHVSTVKKAEAGRPMSAETASAVCAVLQVVPGAFVPPRWGLAETPGAGGDTASTSVEAPGPKVIAPLDEVASSPGHRSRGIVHRSAIPALLLAAVVC